MKRLLSCILGIWMLAMAFLPAIPVAYALNSVPDLTGYIRNRKNRHFVESMLGYHLTENTAVLETLQDGFSAVFLFEGCSDNMADPDLADISYYRVSAVCLALKLDEEGNPEITYFSENCSTLPDRPLEYGAWELEEVGAVGPATICDGTYELYSVYHGGAYEALQMRTTFEDETVLAMYMTPEGYVMHPATYINIHTRNVNHALTGAMWSAGCMLVGDGDFLEYAKLVAATYYSNYDRFEVGQKVGTVTVNRQHLKEALYGLYESQDAVEALLTSSRCELPEIYLERCSRNSDFGESRTVQALGDTSLMSLPCSNSMDARSIPVTVISQGDKIDICGSVVNTGGELWYEVNFFDENCYVQAERVETPPKTWKEIVADWFSSVLNI